MPIVLPCPICKKEGLKPHAEWGPTFVELEAVEPEHARGAKNMLRCQNGHVFYMMLQQKKGILGR